MGLYGYIKCPLLFWRLLFFWFLVWSRFDRLATLYFPLELWTRRRRSLLTLCQSFRSSQQRDDFFTTTRFLPSPKNISTNGLCSSISVFPGKFRNLTPRRSDNLSSLVTVICFTWSFLVRVGAHDLILQKNRSGSRISSFVINLNCIAVLIAWVLHCSTSSMINSSGNSKVSRHYVFSSALFFEIEEYVKYADDICFISFEKPILLTRPSISFTLQFEIIEKLVVNNRNLRKSFSHGWLPNKGGKKSCGLLILRKCKIIRIKQCELISIHE